MVSIMELLNPVIEFNIALSGITGNIRHIHTLMTVEIYSTILSVGITLGLFSSLLSIKFGARRR